MCIRDSLDAESIDWLEQHLQQYEGTVIAVTPVSYTHLDVYKRQLLN